MIASFVIVPVEEKEIKVSHQNTLAPIPLVYSEVKCHAFNTSVLVAKSSTYYYVCMQVKHLQFLSGIHPSSYWLASYAWDMLNTLFPIILTIRCL